MTELDSRRAGTRADAFAFPSDGTAAEQLEFAVRYAILAPSSHNTQPWIFRIQGDSVDLFADRTRALPVVDPLDRELTISCGAALFHLQLALRSHGVESHALLFPDPHDPDLLARVSISGACLAGATEVEMFRAILDRRTNRHAFGPRALSSVLTTQLEIAAESEDVEVFMAPDLETRSAMATLVAQGDRVQMADPSFRRELAAWVHHNRTRALDGMRGKDFGIGDVMSLAEPLVIRRFDMGGKRAAKDHELATGAPLLALLCSRSDTARDWLMVGRALARVLLQATAAGVSASHLNQPIEVPGLRHRLAELTCGAERFPQILLRLGFSSTIPSSTPRRPIEDVEW